MAKPAARIIVFQVVLALAAAAIVVRSVVLQVVQHAHWRARAEQRKVTRAVPPRRGTIYDRNGVVLATSEQQFRFSVSVRELRDTTVLINQLPQLLGMKAERVRKMFTAEYPYFQGPYTAEQIDPLRKLRGIHLIPVYRRVYPQDSTASALIGVLNEGGTAGISGIESSLDTLLRGTAGEERAWRDAGGNTLDSPAAIVRDPIAGKSVYLTIDRELQNIAESELLSTVQEHHAYGGDFVIYDVETGEILASASFRHDSITGRMNRTASAMVESYEPGSTAKPFTAAAILNTGSDTTPVSGENGKWLQHVTDKYIRTIIDVHRANGLLGLGEAIKVSSNIAMSKFSLHLDPNAYFETLRAFGFGTGLALNFPGEDPGILRLPSKWDSPNLARPSMATGYYFQVTTTHLAAGYAAIGNHGILLAPTLIREIHDGGTVAYRHQPTMIRRAIPDSVAQHLMHYLAMVTDTGGTGLQAQLDDRELVGKTGTAVLKSSAKGAERQHRGSFAGLYPVEHPKIAFVVMIDRPAGGTYYGGTVAAPMIRTALQSAIALVGAPIGSRKPSLISAPMMSAARDPVERPVQLVHFPLVDAAAGDTGLIVLPDLAGRSIRDATFTLHQLGFEVKLLGRGKVRFTVPAAGDSLSRGASVTIRADSLP